MPPAKLSDLETLFGRVLLSVLGFAGIVLFVMLLLGGLKYITSGGDPKAAQGAKMTLTYAIGGLFLILCSFLVLLLIQTVFNVDVIHFRIRQ